MQDSFRDRNTRATGLGILALVVLAVVGLVLLELGPFGCSGDSGEQTEGEHAQARTEQPADSPAGSSSEQPAGGVTTDEPSAAPEPTMEPSATDEQPTSANAPVADQPEPESAPQPTATQAQPPEPVSFASAESLYHAREFARSAQAFATYTQQHPDNAWGFYMLGLASWKAGDLGQAEQALRTTIGRDPDHLKSHINLARVLLDDQRPREALQEAKTAVMLAADQAVAQRTLGRCYHALGQLEDAASAFQSAVALDPRDAWSFNSLGLLYIEQERFAEALAPLANAVLLRDEVAEFQNNLGVALERNGFLLDAADAYGRALETDRSYAKAAVSLARVEALSSGVDSPRASLSALAAQYQAIPGRDAETQPEQPVSDEASVPASAAPLPDSSADAPVDLSPVSPPSGSGLAQSDEPR